MNYTYKKHGKQYPPMAITINDVKYSYETLRKNLPYVIEYNENTKNYYIINRNYEYIGYNNIKYIYDIEINDNTIWKRIYLFI